MVWVNTETCGSVGSDRVAIADPTISMVTAVVPMTSMRLPKALLLRWRGVPS